MNVPVETVKFDILVTIPPLAIAVPVPVALVPCVIVTVPSEKVPPNGILRNVKLYVVSDSSVYESAGNDNELVIPFTRYNVAKSFGLLGIVRIFVVSFVAVVKSNPNGISITIHLSSVQVVRCTIDDK